MVDMFREQILEDVKKNRVAPFMSHSITNAETFVFLHYVKIQLFAYLYHNNDKHLSQAMHICFTLMLKNSAM